MFLVPNRAKVVHNKYLMFSLVENLSRSGLSLALPKVVEEIFGDRLHKDVVVHSGKLLQFLGGMEDKLTAEHVDLIWRSCVKESRSVNLKVRGTGDAGVVRWGGERQGRGMRWESLLEKLLTVCAWACLVFSAAAAPELSSSISGRRRHCRPQ